MRIKKNHNQKIYIHFLYKIIYDKKSMDIEKRNKNQKVCIIL